jgi:hypothetical protein
MPTEINLNSQVRIQEDVLFQELQGEAVLLNLKTGVYLGLDQLGTKIWQLLQQNASLNKVVDSVLQEYAVTHEQFAKDLLTLVGQMERQGLIEVR